MHSEIQKNLSKVYLLRSVQVVLTKASYSSTNKYYDKGPFRELELI